MNKIVLITEKDGTIYWLPYSLETLNALSTLCQDIKDIQIIDCRVSSMQYIIKKVQEPTMKKYLFTITLLDHSIEQTEAYCDCPIDWVVSNYHHDDMLDWSWIEIVGGEQ